MASTMARQKKVGLGRMVEDSDRRENKLPAKLRHNQTRTRTRARMVRCGFEVCRRWWNRRPATEIDSHAVTSPVCGQLAGGNTQVG